MDFAGDGADAAGADVYPRLLALAEGTDVRRRPALLTDPRLVLVWPDHAAALFV